MPSNPNSNARDVTVNIFIHPGDPQGDFHFETTDLPMGPGNHLYFENFGKPGLNVKFVLQTPGYTFPSDPDDACWVHAQAACPTGKCQWGQFKPWDSAGNFLTVYNKNQSKAQFGYTLWAEQGGKRIELDPIANNQNGPSRSGSSSYAAVIGGVIVGALLTVGVQAMMR